MLASSVLLCAEYAGFPLTDRQDQEAEASNYPQIAQQGQNPHADVAVCLRPRRGTLLLILNAEGVFIILLAYTRSTVTVPRIHSTTA